jgi:hypothetical protein
MLLDGLDDSPLSAFSAFLSFSDWLWQSTGKTHEFALEKLVDLLFEHLTGPRAMPEDTVRQALLADYQASGARAKPKCLAELLQAASPSLTPTGQARAQRQSRHVSQHLTGQLRSEIQQAAAAA